MKTYSENSLKIFEKIFDNIPKKNDKYLTRKEFNSVINNKEIGCDIIFFCKIAGKPIFFLFEQGDIKKEGKIFKDDFINLLAVQSKKKRKKKK